MLKRLCFVFFLAIFVFACGDDDSSVDEMNSALSDFNQSTKNFAKNRCVCIANSNYAGNMAQCVAGETPAELVSTKCEKKVAECYAEDFGIFLRCSRNAVDEFAECIKNCSRASQCHATYQNKMIICQSNVPTDLRISMDACDSGQKFSCDS